MNESLSRDACVRFNDGRDRKWEENWNEIKYHGKRGANKWNEIIKKVTMNKQISKKIKENIYIEWPDGERKKERK